MSNFIGNFSDVSDIEQNFQLAENSLNDVNILLAWYEYESYDGSAFVLFEKDGKLYEVNGSHCSCYGLEGQWEPEETSVEALTHRIKNGYLGMAGCYTEGGFKNQLLKILENL